MDIKGNGDVGTKRLITLPNGLVLTEELLALDNNTHTQVYAVTKKGDVPCSYTGTIHVDKNNGKTRARWWCQEYLSIEKQEEGQKHLNTISNNVKQGFISLDKS